VWASGLLWGYKDPSSNKLWGRGMGVRYLVVGGGLAVLTWGPIPSLLSISSQLLSSHLPQLLCPSRKPICGLGGM